MPKPSRPSRSSRPTHRRCIACEQTKPIAEFSKANGGRTYQSRCKACHALYYRERYHNEPGFKERRKLHAQQRVWSRAQIARREQERKPS